MNDLLAKLIVCHLVGDFILQNDSMQEKSRDSFTCFIHCGMYTMPFMYVMGNTWHMPLLVLLIAVQHYFQDRYGLHLKWMKLYGQTPPEKWPVGPLCVDQSFHIGFICLAYSVVSRWM